MPRIKEIYEKKSDALKAKKEQKSSLGFDVFKIKFGKNKGKYFCGTYMEYINRF